MNLYVIFDKIAKESGPIFEAKNDGVALRNYRSLLEKEKINQNEYSLHLLGRYEHSTMSVFIHDQVEVINESAV